MKVIFTVAGLQPESGGLARSLPSLCAALASEGVAVELVSLDFGSARGQPLLPRHPHVRVSLAPCNGWMQRRLPWSPRFSAVLRERCSQADGAIVHDTGLWLPTNHAAATAACHARLPFIVSPRGMLAPWALGFKRWKKKFAWHLYQRRDLRCAKALHATSSLEAREIRALGFRQPIAVIPNGVEIPDFPDDRPQDNNQRVVLFLSRIHPVKGLLNLVRAWAQLRPANWRMVVAGGNETGHQAEVEAAVREAGLNSIFSFVGPVDDQQKWERYRSADLFVLPSHSENFGLVVAEALACGVPVITTKATPWQVLEQHQCGWWVDVGVEPLARALREATSINEAERHDMGQRGRKLIEQQYTWPSVAGQMVSVYRWLLGEGERPACFV